MNTNFDLNAYGVEEINESEMMSVERGNIFEDAWNWISETAESFWDWCCDLGIVINGTRVK
jgi:hypothetical protein